MEVNFSEQNKIVIKNIVGTFVVKGASIIISIVLLPLYLRFFQRQELLGVWYTILSVLNWIVLFDLGLGQGLRNQLPQALISNDKKLAKEYISTTYFSMMIVAAIVTIIGMVIIHNINLYKVFNVNETIVKYPQLEKSVKIIFAGIMLQMVLKIITFVLYAMQKSAVVSLQVFMTNLIILSALLVIPSQDMESNLIIMSWINVVAANTPYIVCTILVFTMKHNLPRSQKSKKSADYPYQTKKE